MVAMNPPVWLQAGQYSAEHDRLVTGLLTDRTFDKAGAFVTLEAGVVPGPTQLQVTSQSGVSMTVDISNGVAIIPRTSIEPPGAYICYNNGTATLALTPVTTNPRIDVVVARVLDSQQGQAGDIWELGVVSTAESPNAVAPTINDAWIRTNGIPLASVKVLPASQNGGQNKILAGQITDARTFVSGLGGVHVAWGGRLPAQSPGRVVWNPTTSQLMVSDGTSYKELWQTQSAISYLGAYHPAQIYDGTTCRVTSPETWYSSIVDNTTDKAQPEISIPSIRSPSGWFRVSIQGIGRVATAGDVAIQSFQMISGSTIIVDGSTDRANTYYDTQWGNGYREVILGGSAYANTAYKFRLVFKRDKGASVPASSTTYFARNRLIVNAVP
jgi:hypothetical protein